MTFSEAKIHCENLGAKLFEPSSLHIQNIVVSFMNSLKYRSYYWLGISKTGGGEWRWLSNNSLINWTNWLNGHPRRRKNCIYVSTYTNSHRDKGLNDLDREWISTICASDTNYVICEKSTITLESYLLLTTSNGTGGLLLEPSISAISSM